MLRPKAKVSLPLGPRLKSIRSIHLHLPKLCFHSPPSLYLQLHFTIIRSSLLFPSLLFGRAVASYTPSSFLLDKSIDSFKSRGPSTQGMESS